MSTAKAIGRSLSFALWSLRRSVGQMLPVGVAFVLLVGAIQIIGTLHDVSSTLAQQQIARSWRNGYDLFVRPQAAVSQTERATGLIDPQSMLESYGGINDAQVTTIRALPHVTQVMPFATVGWQGVEVVVPVSLVHVGVYRITARWPGQAQFTSSSSSYVDVTDLPHLLNEPPVTSPIVQHLLMTSTTPVVYQMPVQALQAVVGIPASQQTSLQSMLSQSGTPTTVVHLSLSVERLNGTIGDLPACTGNTHCWQSEQAQQGQLSYLSNGVQLLRFTSTRYAATAQQIAGGQIAVLASGSDVQGNLYRTVLPEYITLPGDARNAFSQAALAPSTGLLPLTGPEHLPLIPSAVRFIPLAQACAVNGASCYSGLYIQLSDVDHYSQQSLALLQATAAAITARTGLHVDILDGSSTRTISLVTPATPTNSSVSLSSTWREVGVAVQIVHGVDTLQETLLILCSFVCLLAVGAAGVLIGIGRRKETLLLQQIGWSRALIALMIALDALILCLPGALLSSVEIVAATKLWPGSLSTLIIWSLLGAGVIIYCLTLTSIALPGGGRNSLRPGILTPQRTPHSHRMLSPAITSDLFMKWQSVRRSKVFHTKVTAPVVCAVAVMCAVFLIAIEYLLVTDFNKVLVVTILGKQVREALEGPQVALLLVVLVAALLTIGLCTALLLRGRRYELSLLSMVGWERRFVVRRILWDSGWPALLSGEAGALLALLAIMLTATAPSWWAILGLIVCGPLAGILLVSIVTAGMAWRETERVFAWKI